MPSNDAVVPAAPAPFLAGLTSKETARNFFARLRERGFHGMSQSLGCSETTLRRELEQFVNSRVSDLLVLQWTGDPPPPDPKYTAPPAILLVSDLVDIYALDARLGRSWDGDNLTEAVDAGLGDLTNVYLERSAAVFAAAVEALGDDSIKTQHEHVHLSEVLHTCGSTVLQLFEAMKGKTPPDDRKWRDGKIWFEMNRHFGGLIDSPDLVSDLDPMEKKTSRRLPPTTHRSGGNISYDEIANVYRISRVTVEKIEEAGIRNLRSGFPKTPDFAGPLPEAGFFDEAE